MNYTLYKVNNKVKSSVKGIWKAGGHTYFDSIHLTRYSKKSLLDGGIIDLFRQGELAVFYTYNNTGIIKSNNGKIDKLTNRQILKRQKLSIQEVKSLLQEFGGLTIYRKENGYLIEVYSKKGGKV